MSQPDVRSAFAPADPRERLILAVDVPDINTARAVVEETREAVGVFKIGHQLLYAGGLELARELAADGIGVFLDVKLHDIPNTVTEGVRTISRLGVRYATVHAYPQTLAAAVVGRGEAGPAILAVTVMTSLNDADLAEAGFRDGVADTVRVRARQAETAGAEGLVCSVHEAPSLRALVPGMVLVTPGIRPAGEASGDQKRTATPAEAVRGGADLMVVGRPILGATDRRAAAEAIVEEIAAAGG